MPNTERSFVLSVFSAQNLVNFRTYLFFALVAVELFDIKKHGLKKKNAPYG